jgi:hypothetical protein
MRCNERGGGWRGVVTFLIVTLSRKLTGIAPLIENGHPLVTLHPGGSGRMNEAKCRNLPLEPMSVTFDYRIALVPTKGRQDIGNAMLSLAV